MGSPQPLQISVTDSAWRSSLLEEIMSYRHWHWLLTLYFWRTVCILAHHQWEGTRPSCLPGEARRSGIWSILGEISVLWTGCLLHWRKRIGIMILKSFNSFTHPWQLDDTLHTSLWTGCRNILHKPASPGYKDNWHKDSLPRLPTLMLCAAPWASAWPHTEQLKQARW